MTIVSKFVFTLVLVPTLSFAGDPTTHLFGCHDQLSTVQIISTAQITNVLEELKNLQIHEHGAVARVSFESTRESEEVIQRLASQTPSDQREVKSLLTKSKLNSNQMFTHEVLVPWRYLREVMFELDQIVNPKRHNVLAEFRNIRIDEHGAVARVSFERAIETEEVIQRLASQTPSDQRELKSLLTKSKLNPNQMFTHEVLVPWIYLRGFMIELGQFMDELEQIVNRKRQAGANGQPRSKTSNPDGDFEPAPTMP